MIRMCMLMMLARHERAMQSLWMAKPYASVIFTMVRIAMVHAQIISAKPSNANGAKKLVLTKEFKVALLNVGAFSEDQVEAIVQEMTSNIL